MKPHSALTFSPLYRCPAQPVLSRGLSSDFGMPDSMGPLLSLPQDFRSNPFSHLATYLCLSLVAAQFVLSCLVDQPSFFPKEPQQSVSCRVSLTSTSGLALPMGQKGAKLEPKPLSMFHAFFHSAKWVLSISALCHGLANFF